MAKQVMVDDDTHRILVEYAENNGSTAAGTIRKLVEGLEKKDDVPFTNEQMGYLMKNFVHRVAMTESNLPHTIEQNTKIEDRLKSSHKVAVAHTPVPKNIFEQPCCKGKSPCRHWSFDGEVWKNSLSGRIREVE